MGNTTRRINFLTLLTVGFLLQSWAQDPFLAWNYQSLLTDQRPSGVNPEFQIDPEGNFHLFYWDKNRDKLVYGVKAHNAQVWEMEWVDSTSANGFKSSFFLDSQGITHVAYLSNQGGLAWLNYAKRTETRWERESVPVNSDLGKYGFDEEFPIYAQASIDLAIKSDGEPLISYFDGTVFESSIFYCGAASDGLVNIYTDYELEMELAYKEDGSWQIIDTLDVAYKGPQNCLIPNGDRFGEFNNIIMFPDSTFKIFTNSLHNNELIFFSGSEKNLSKWEYHVIDSVDRFASSGLIAGEGDREGFDFMEVKQLGDGLIHMIYGMSDLYGYASPNAYIRASDYGRRTFFYARIHPDSLEVQGYAPDFEEMVSRSSPTNPNSHDGNLRSLYTLSLEDDNHVFLGHYNYASNEVVFQESLTGGDVWIADTLGSWQTNSPLRSAIWEDSLHVVFYDALDDQIIWASRDLDTAVWNIRPLLPSRTYGDVIASAADETQDSIKIHVAFSETVDNQLFLGTYQDFSWTYEAIDQPGNIIEHIWVGSDDKNEPLMVYSIKNSSQLKIASQDQGLWSCEEIEGGVQISQLQAAISLDSIYVVYFDRNSQLLKWAVSPMSPPFDWRIGVVEQDSIEPTGDALSLKMDNENRLHLSYRNIFNPLFKYATYNPSNPGWVIDTLSTTEQYFVGENDLTIRENGRVVIVFRDEVSNNLFLIEQQIDASWEITPIPTVNNNFIGFSMEVFVDELDQIWVVYSSALNQNELKATRKSASGIWEEVPILNNRGQIAQNYDIHLRDDYLFIVGKMTNPNNSGIGILWADQAISTSSSFPLPNEKAVQLWPNPVKDRLNISIASSSQAISSISIFNLEGKVVLQKDLGTSPFLDSYNEVLMVDFLPKGLYVCEIQVGNQRFVTKFIR